VLGLTSGVSSPGVNFASPKRKCRMADIERVCVDNFVTLAEARVHCLDLLIFVEGAAEDALVGAARPRSQDRGCAC
jgi:hypothetical protein